MAATAVTDPSKALAPIKARATKMQAVVDALVIKDQIGLNEATKIRSGIKDVAKQIDAKKKEITAPLNTALKNVRALFAPVETACEEASRAVDRKVIVYSQEVEKTRQEEETRLAARVEKGTLKVETAAKKMEALPEAQRHVETDRGSMTIRKIRKTRIVDLALLPREYLVPDEVLIRKDALAGKVIPGVEVYEEDSVASY